jgi:TRAP-type C4-dicarboxylate transport system permease large subunit
MITVIIPFILLLVLMLGKKVPYIGGDVRWALALAGLASLLLGGVYSPLGWLMALYNGVNNLSWVIMLILVGGLFSQIQVESGAMDTFLNFMRACFGRSPRGLLVTMMLFLVVAGSLFGDAAAAVTVIGFMGITALAELNLSGEQISASLVMGAAMGSIMPPITQAVFLACSLVGLEDPSPAVNIAYFTVGIAAILMCLYASRWVKLKTLPEHLIPEERAWQIIKSGWKVLMPFLLLFVIVLFQAFGINVLSFLSNALAPISEVPIIKGITNKVVLAITVCIIASFIYTPVRKNSGKILKGGFMKVLEPLLIMICACFLVGAFSAGGQVIVVKEFATGLKADVLKIGGSVAMCLMGMITGLQSATQSTIFTVFGPALISNGVAPVHAAVSGAHLAMAGQGLPPADMLTFLTAGFVGGVLGKKVDPLRSMMYSMPMCIYYIIVGILFLYI